MESNDDIQKARFFPSRLLESLRKGSPPYECDLHGYKCKQAADLMRRAFSDPLHVAAAYTFILGAGRHSSKKYQVELSKACCKGLIAAGLTEDRHAGDGAVGKFKCMNTNNSDVCMVKVFPKILAHVNGLHAVPVCTPGTAVAAAVETIELVDSSRMAAIERVCKRCAREHLAELSILDLTEILVDLLPLLQEVSSGRRKLRLGAVLTSNEDLTVASSEPLQGAWRAAFSQWRHKLDASAAFSPKEKSTCYHMLEQIQQSHLSKAGQVDDLLKSLDAKPEKKTEHPSIPKLRRLLRAVEAELQKAEDIHLRWESGKHSFPSVQDQKHALERLGQLRKQHAELKSNMEAVELGKDVACPQLLGTLPSTPSPSSSARARSRGTNARPQARKASIPRARSQTHPDIRSPAPVRQASIPRARSQTHLDIWPPTSERQGSIPRARSQTHPDIRTSTQKPSPGSTSLASQDGHTTSVVTSCAKLQPRCRVELLQDVLSGMCSEGPILLADVEMRYLDWTGESLKVVASSVGHTVLSLLSSIHGCKLVWEQGSNLCRLQRTDECVAKAACVLPDTKSTAVPPPPAASTAPRASQRQELREAPPDPSVKHATLGESGTGRRGPSSSRARDLPRSREHSRDTSPIAEPAETRSRSAYSLKVVLSDWDASSYGSEYLSLSSGEELWDKGLQEQGWVFGEIRNPNGTLARSGWYPPTYVRNKAFVVNAPSDHCYEID